MSEPAQPAPTLGELHHALSVFERERDSLLATIREARAEARKETVQASCCRQPIPKEVISAWQRRIKDSAAELVSVEQKIGTTNKALRAIKAANKSAIKSLTQLPEGVVVRSNPPPAKAVPANGEINPNPKQGHVLFLQFFHQLVSENLDPRMVEVLETDAHSLVNAYRATHQKEVET
jgi:hypothetical protein